MKEIIKKTFVLAMVFIMALPWTIVMAQESTGDAEGFPSALTVRAGLSINREAAGSIMDMFGVSGEQAKTADSVLALVSAMGSRLTYAEDGFQLDLDLKGTDVLSVGGELTDEGVTIVSTLFPNYVLTCSWDTLMSLMGSGVSQTGGDGTGNAPGMDMSVLASFPSEALERYLSQFMQACIAAAVPGDPEETDFTYQGVAFNTRVPVMIDIAAVADAEKELIEQLLSDESVFPMLEMMMQFSGGSLDADSIRDMNDEIMSADHLPTVESNFYTQTTDFYALEENADNANEVYCIVSEATYKDAEEPSYRFTFLSQGTVGDLRFEALDQQSSFAFYYGSEETGMNMRISCDISGMAAGLALDVAFGTDTVLNYDLYFLDPEKPLAQGTVTVSGGEERTLPVDMEGKDVLTAAEILGKDGMEAANGLMNDILVNGFGPLVSKAAMAVPEVQDLMAAMSGTDGQGLEQDDDDAGTRILQLGSSVYTVKIPESFIEGERSEEDIRDDLVAYYYSPESLLDFDIYEFSKEGYPEDLASFTEQEAAEYGAFVIVTDDDVNGIDAAWYKAMETYEEKEYETLTYVLDGGLEYVEITFWLDGETAEEEAMAIINSLTFVQRQTMEPTDAADDVTQESDSAAVDSSAWKTLADVLALETEGMERGTTGEGQYYLAFKYGGKYWAVIADFSDDLFQKLMGIDVFADDRKEQELAILGPCEIVSAVDLGTLAIQQEELDQWIGKKGQDLLDAGWEADGYSYGDDSLLISMVKGDFRYLVSFNEKIEMPQSFDEDPDFADKTICGIVFDGHSYHYFG